MKKVFILLSFVLISMCSFSIENKNDEIKDLDSRLKTIESKMIDLEVQKKLLETEKERLVSELNITIDKKLIENKMKLDDKTKNIIEKNTKGIGDWYFWKKIVCIILAFLGLFSIGSYFYIGYKAKKVADEKLDRILDEKKEKFLKLIKENELEVKLKSEKKLIIISKDESGNSLCQQYSKVERVNILSKFNITDESLVIINDLEAIFTEAELKKVLQKRNGKTILHFINGNSKIYNERDVYCSNNKLTFYNHLMSALKYT